MSATQEQVHSALKEVLDPNTGTDFLANKSARNIKVEGGTVSLEIELGYPAKTQLDPIRKLVAGKLRGVPGVSAVNVSVTSKIVADAVQRRGTRSRGVRELRRRDVAHLIGDMPRGSGDIQLTLAQKVPVTGVVIVTTPQDIALIDARKGLKMFEKVGIPILGIVENMSTHICSQCGHEEHIFGQGGAERMCKEYGTELLGSLPLDIAIREQADSGKPTVVADPDGRAAEIYRAIGRRLAVKLAESPRAMTSKFPNIVVSKHT